MDRHNLELGLAAAFPVSGSYEHTLIDLQLAGTIPVSRPMPRACRSVLYLPIKGERQGQNGADQSRAVTSTVWEYGIYLNIPANPPPFASVPVTLMRCPRSALRSL